MLKEEFTALVKAVRKEVEEKQIEPKTWLNKTDGVELYYKVPIDDESKDFLLLWVKVTKEDDKVTRSATIGGVPIPEDLAVFFIDKAIKAEQAELENRAAALELSAKELRDTSLWL